MADSPYPETPSLGDGLFANDMASCPQPVYKMMRENAPVIRLGEDSVLLTHHDEVMQALRGADLFSSDMEAVALGNVRPLIPLQIDPPDHLKYRKLLDPLFAPREVAALETEVRRLTNELIDDFIAVGEV